MAKKLRQWLNEYWEAARNPNGLEPPRIDESGHEYETSPLDMLLRDAREGDSDQFENGSPQKLTWGPVRHFVSSVCLLIGIMSGILFFVAFLSMPAPQGGHVTRELNRLGNALMMFGSLITLFVFPLIGLTVDSIDVRLQKSHDQIRVTRNGNIGCVLAAVFLFVLILLNLK